METECLREEYSLCWKGHIQHVQDSFARLLQRNEFCDVTLYVEGQRIGAHKIFLTTCSGYFKQLFEDLKDERPIIVLKGIRFDILQQVLKFMYNGQVSIEMEQLSAFLETAQFLKIYGLIEDKVVRGKTHLVSGIDKANNTNNEHPRQSNSIHDLNNRCVEETPLPTELGLECAAALTKALQGTESERQQFISSKQKSSTSIRNSSSFSNSEYENKKYSLESPKRSTEWTSEYESRTQNNTMPMLVPLPQEGSDSAQSKLDYVPSLVKRKRLKSERLSWNIGGIQEVQQFSEQDFANNLDADVELTTDEEDDDDNLLEKEMLKTYLTSLSKNSFQCNICSKIYTTKDSLKKHFEVHTKDTTCMICGLTLSRRSHLKRHLKIHGISGQ